MCQVVALPMSYGGLCHASSFVSSPGALMTNQSHRGASTCTPFTKYNSVSLPTYVWVSVCVCVCVCVSLSPLVCVCVCVCVCVMEECSGGKKPIVYHLNEA